MARRAEARPNLKSQIVTSSAGILRDKVDRSILLVRGERVILDVELAVLYGVETKALNQAVKRNRERFPEDFVFPLNAHESAALRSQFVTSNVGRGGRRYRPFAFTEHGAIMAANLLNSRRAVLASVAVVRAFVRLRQVLAAHSDLARKLEELENKYDSQFKVVFQAIRRLMEPPPKEPSRIGFRPQNLRSQSVTLERPSGTLR